MTCSGGPIDLLRHQIPSGDVGEVMAKALKVLVRELEKEKIAATDRPRNSPVTGARSRHICHGRTLSSHPGCG
jgi:hypothetical protein